MRPILIALALTLTATPALAEGPMIDATTLTVAELLALAAAEREAPTPLSCCDWGGMGCAVRLPGS